MVTGAWIYANFSIDSIAELLNKINHRFMTEEEFNKLKNKGFNRVPVIRKKLADLDTFSIYLKIANEPNTYLFESVVDGERFGRYSFIGLSLTTFEVKGKNVTNYLK